MNSLNKFNGPAGPKINFFLNIFLRSIIENHRLTVGIFKGWHSKTFRNYRQEFFLQRPPTANLVFFQ